MRRSLFHPMGVIWCTLLTALSGCTPMMPPVDESDEDPYRARVSIDPTDRSAVSGYVRLGMVRSARMTAGTAGLVQNLTVVIDMMNRQTNIRTERGPNLLFSDLRLFELPAIVVPPDKPTEAELEQLTRYLVEGGFVLTPDKDDFRNFRIFREGLEKYAGLVWDRDAYLEALDDPHPIFTTFFDVTGIRLKGLVVHDRLAGVSLELPDLSAVPREERGAMIRDYLPLYRMTVNCFIYALIQESSLAERITVQ